MKRFVVTYKNMRNGRGGGNNSPINYYAVDENQVRKHFDEKGYAVVSIRECSTLI